MKTRILNKGEERCNEIDWSKPQLAKSIYGLIVLVSNKTLTSTNKFSGVVVNEENSEEKLYGVGHYSEEWEKSNFSKIDLPVTIEFNND